MVADKKSGDDFEECIVGINASVNTAEALRSAIMENFMVTS
jgi:hypothetical protein